MEVWGGEHMASRAVKQAEIVKVRMTLSSLAFNPSGPVSDKDLFAGRESQITDVLGAVGQSGQHVILFGERGVGKTSLASLTHEFGPTCRGIPTYVQCAVIAAAQIRTNPFGKRLLSL